MLLLCGSLPPCGRRSRSLRRIEPSVPGVGNSAWYEMHLPLGNARMALCQGQQWQALPKMKAVTIYKVTLQQQSTISSCATYMTQVSGTLYGRTV